MKKALIIFGLAAIVWFILFPAQNFVLDFILRFGSAIHGI